MGKDSSIKKYSYLFYLVLSIAVILLGRTSFNETIKYPFSYAFNPIYVFASESGQSVVNWTQALVDASSYIKEYNQMKEEIVNLRIENSEKLLDYEEYKTLKEHISLIGTQSKYVQSKVLNLNDGNEIIINKGSESGISKGDIVVLGRVFVGIVTDVNPKTSLVRLPLNDSSTFEVVIIPSTINLNDQPSIDSFVKSKGVVLGRGDDIRVENLGINSNVSDGDTILIKDERVEEILILGNLVGVSTNPASTQKNGFVAPIFDYSNILTVYVKVE